MTTELDPQRSADQIRRRLFGLLMQAFGIVVAVTVVVLLGLLAALLGAVANGSFGPRPPVARQLEAYYLGRGSWEGVKAVTAPDPERPNFNNPNDWSSLTLLDAGGRVLLYQGSATADEVGRPFAPDGHGIRFPLSAKGTAIGTLVLHGGNWAGRVGVFSGLLIPVLVISFFTGLLTLLIGFLLARRVVTPLADVAAAAQRVAAGDLTARVQVRGPGDLRSLSDSFNRMAGALESSDQQRRALLADIAHELRTPLTIIRGKLEGMLDGVYPADEAHVAPVLEESYVLERLVEDLRTLTLAETRQLHFDPQPVSLNELAERAAGLFEAEAAERGIGLTTALAAGLPEVQADAQRVGQVIGNLLSNALRYAPAQGQVTISTRRTDEGVEVAVSDTGPGVAAEDLPHLFDRFWRGEKSRNRAMGGAGLGLAIARQLIEAQGGQIAAENRAEGGLRLAFVLPGGGESQASRARADNAA
ncbi:MAG: HAMP domain-containing protein [Anaerolineales bacterium]|nr:HAMP domain-containing protein [Anaerolineales bacterium]